MMDVQAPARIFLADQRHLDETESYRRYSNFNGDNDAFGNLTLFNDEIIAAGKTVELIVDVNSYFMVMPVTGIVGVQVDDQLNTKADAGQILISYVHKGSIIKLQNDYDADWINLLYLQIKADSMTPIAQQIIDFDPVAQHDQLINLLPEGLPFAMQIGLFQGRNEALYRVRSKQSRLFAFVLAGAFEFQGRLLHERDGLALWNFEEADMEALSNNAIVVLVELY